MIFDHDKLNILDDAREAIRLALEYQTVEPAVYMAVEWRGKIARLLVNYDASRVVFVLKHSDTRYESYVVYINSQFITLVYNSILNDFQHPSYYGFPVRYVLTFANNSLLTAHKTKEIKWLANNTLYSQWFKNEGITEPTDMDWIRYSVETGNDI